MPSWQDTIIIASFLSRNVYGQAIACNSQAVPVAVWPQFNSGGPRAQAAFIWPTNNVHFAIDAVAATSGPNSAILKADQIYPLPIHPAAHTLWFLDATSQTGPVRIAWLVG